MKSSIQNISNQLETLKNNFNEFKIRESNRRNLSDVVSGEHELKDIISDIDFIVNHLSYLIKSHNLFSKYSSLAERQNLNSYLADLNSYLININSDFGEIIRRIDLIKTILRGMGIYIFNKKDDISDFISALENLKIQKSEIETYIAELKKLIEDKKNAIQDIADLEKTLEDLKIKLTDAEEKEGKISELLTSSKSNEQVIINFSNQVSKREEQLTKQQTKTDEYEESLKNYKTEHDIILTDANELIESAKNALKLKTSEAISNTIQTQYEDANKWHKTFPWLLLSFFFVLLTLILGSFIAFPEYVILIFEKLSESKEAFQTNLELITKFINTSDWKLLVGRLALIPVLLSGAIFSAKQYLRQKNIIEDYRYKMVLAQSLVGFSEQFLKHKQETETHAYKEYVENVLKELLQDPIRDRKNDTSKIEDRVKGIFSDTAEIISKFSGNKNG